MALQPQGNLDQQVLSENSHFTLITEDDFDTLVFNKYGLLTKCEVKMVGYWPSSFFACNKLAKKLAINSQKKNEANIQPS